MAYEFKSLADVEILAEVPEGASVLAEVNGAIKRVPGEGLGGAAGIKTIIIKDSQYDNVINGILNPRAGLALEYSCINMTFEEAYQALMNGEPLACLFMTSMPEVPAGAHISGDVLFGDINGYFAIMPEYYTPAGELVGLYWTAEYGLSTFEPGGK